MFWMLFFVSSYCEQNYWALWRQVSRYTATTYIWGGNENFYHDVSWCFMMKCVGIKVWPAELAWCDGTGRSESIRSCSSQVGPLDSLRETSWRRQEEGAGRRTSSWGSQWLFTSHHPAGSSLRPVRGSQHDWPVCLSRRPADIPDWPDLWRGGRRPGEMVKWQAPLRVLFSELIWK